MGMPHPPPPAWASEADEATSMSARPTAIIVLLLILLSFVPISAQDLLHLDEGRSMHRLPQEREPVQHDLILAGAERPLRDLEETDKIGESVLVHVLGFALEPLVVPLHVDHPREGGEASQREGSRVDSRGVQGA